MSDKVDGELVDDRVRQLTDAIDRLQKAVKICEGKARWLFLLIICIDSIGIDASAIIGNRLI